MPIAKVSSRNQRRKGCAAARILNTWFFALSLGLCIFMIFLGWRSEGWGAIYVALFASPTANAVLMGLGFPAALIIRRLNPGTALGYMLPSIFGFPAMGALITATAIFMMPLRGC
ncbi:MAG: hypothetical protein V4726_16105 [Verrucomicrobiota bacterium]